LPFAPIDERGKLVFADSFEDSPSDQFGGSLGAWATSIDGDGGRIVRTGAQANTGLHSLLLEPPTTPLKRTQISKQIPLFLPNVTRVGLEVSIKPTHALQIGDEIGVYLFVFDGSFYHYFAVRYVHAALPSIDYRNIDGTWSAIWIGSLTDAPTLFFPVKIVADVTTDEYVRAVVMGREFDLTGIPIQKVAALESGGHANINIDAWAGTANFSSGFYVDDVKVTAAEPEASSPTLPAVP